MVTIGDKNRTIILPVPLQREHTLRFSSIPLPLHRGHA